MEQKLSDSLELFDSYPDSHSDVEEKVGCDYDNVREAEGLCDGVEVDGGVRHPRCSQEQARNNAKTHTPAGIDLCLRPHLNTHLLNLNLPPHQPAGSHQEEHTP